MMSNSRNKDPKYAKLLISTNYTCRLDKMYLAVDSIVWSLFEQMMGSVQRFEYTLPNGGFSQSYLQVMRPVNLSDLKYLIGL